MRASLRRYDSGRRGLDLPNRHSASRTWLGNHRSGGYRSSSSSTTSAQGVSVWGARRCSPRMCSTEKPRTTKASAIILRWQRHLTASEHIRQTRSSQSSTSRSKPWRGCWRRRYYWASWGPLRRGTPDWWALAIALADARAAAFALVTLAVLLQGAQMYLPVRLLYPGKIVGYRGAARPRAALLANRRTLAPDPRRPASQSPGPRSLRARPDLAAGAYRRPAPRWRAFAAGRRIRGKDTAPGVL